MPVCMGGMLLNVIALFCLHKPPKIRSGVLVYLHAILMLDVAHLLGIAALQIEPLCWALDYSICSLYRRAIFHVSYNYTSHARTLSNGFKRQN